MEAMNFTVLILFLVGIAVFFLVMALGLYVSRGEMAVARRLDAVRAKKGKPLHLIIDTSDSIWARLSKEIEARNMFDSTVVLRKKFIRAGLRSAIVPFIFSAMRIVLFFALPAIYLYFNSEFVSGRDFVNKSFFTLILAVAGFYLPSIWLSMRISKREFQLLGGFPDALDLMVVCVEAGLGLEATLTRVARELVIAHPLLAREFAMVAAELRAGKSHGEALRGLSERTGLEDLQSFVALIQQSEKLGSSIARSLRVYAEEMRDKRMMRAEEKAQRLPVLLTIPLVACILPVMVTTIMLPPIIIVIRRVLPALGGN